MSRMHNPPHPGEVIKELCLDPLKLTVTAAADGLGISRRTLSALLNGHAGISPDMAIRLSKAFGRSPEAWLQL
jgi:addiction module HigA family antidote